MENNAQEEFGRIMGDRCTRMIHEGVVRISE